MENYLYSENADPPDQNLADQLRQLDKSDNHIQNTAYFINGLKIGQAASGLALTALTVGYITHHKTDPDGLIHKFNEAKNIAHNVQCSINMFGERTPIGVRPQHAVQCPFQTNST